jgi:hypothetical protein
MSITLDVSDELAEELAAEAARQGVPLEEYAVRILETGRRLSVAPRDGAALVAYWQAEGLIGSRADIGDSQEHARQLRPGKSTQTPAVDAGPG